MLCIICGAIVPEFVTLKSGKQIKKRRADRRFCSLECYYQRETSRESLEQRFWRRVNRNGRQVSQELGPCWEWTGWISGTAESENGYGCFSYGRNRKHIKAHRYSWEIHFGEIPEGQFVLHRCDNKLCCNPSHLFLGTDQDNSDDKVSKGRQQRGESHAHAKLTAEQVRFIKSRRPIETDLLAMQFGVSKAAIRDIFSGKNWKHI